MNLVTYFAFIADKRRAINGARRISEATLLTLALIGGSIGAKAAQRQFRHKTRKQPFATLLNLICIGQVSLLLFVAFQLMR